MMGESEREPKQNITSNNFVMRVNLKVQMIALGEFHGAVLVYSANVTNNSYDKPHISFQTTNRFYFHKKF